jgi:4-amino-4-deoxy-L-arabinose transferase-like glycosyltransferase
MDNGTPGNGKRPAVIKAIILLMIVCIGGFVRFYGLGENPVGLFRDEASTGYDAYCLLETGRDQYGEVFPLFARSFGDYNESLYRFLVVPSVYLFGLTEFAVRFPAAVFGTLTILIFYFLVRLLFDERIGLTVAFFLAVSPWHIGFSRVGFRAILFPFFFSLGFLFFLKFSQKFLGDHDPFYKNGHGRRRQESYLIIFSSIFFSFSLFSYSSARVYVPLFLIVLSVLYFKELKASCREAAVAGIILVVVLVVLGSYWLSSKGMARAGATVATDVGAWVKNYISYFSPNFLFFKGDTNLRHSIQGVGQLYQLEILTVIAGLIGLITTFIKSKDRKWLVLAAGIILYPVPAALTEPGHALRSIIGCFWLPMLSAYGLYWWVDLIKKKSLRVFVIVGVLLTLFAGFFSFGRNYFIDYPYYSWFHWDYGWKQAVAISKQKNYRTIYVSNYFFLPHAFILFYTKYSPREYQRSPIQTLTQENLKILDFSMPPYRITALEGLYSVDCKDALIITFPRQRKILETRMRLKTVGTVPTPDGKNVLIELVEVID